MHRKPTLVARYHHVIEIEDGGEIKAQVILRCSSTLEREQKTFSFFFACSRGRIFRVHARAHLLFPNLLVRGRHCSLGESTRFEQLTTHARGARYHRSTDAANAARIHANFNCHLVFLVLLRPWPLL